MSQSERKRHIQPSAEQDVCELCHGYHQHMSSLHQQRSDKVHDFVKSFGIQGGKICRSCRQDASRAIKDASYVPRWEKRKQRACCVLDCKNNVHALSKMGSTEEIKATFEEAQLQYVSISTPTPLCKVHYHIIYNLMQPRQTHCSTCGLSLRHTTSRPCPQADIIQSHLREVIGFEGSIGAGDKVCYRISSKNSAPLIIRHPLA